MSEPVRAAPILLFFCPLYHPRVWIEEIEKDVFSLPALLPRLPSQNPAFLTGLAPFLLISLPALSQDSTQFGTLCADLSLSLTPEPGHAAETVDACHEGTPADPRIEDHAKTILCLRSRGQPEEKGGEAIRGLNPSGRWPCQFFRNGIRSKSGQFSAMAAVRGEDLSHKLALQTAQSLKGSVENGIETTVMRSASSTT